MKREKYQAVGDCRLEPAFFHNGVHDQGIERIAAGMGDLPVKLDAQDDFGR